MVDHWYQLHIKNFLRAASVAGPLKKDEMMERIQRVIECQDTEQGRAHLAYAVRLDVKSIATFERQNSSWVPVDSAKALPELPKLMCQFVDHHLEGRLAELGADGCELVVQVNADDVAFKVWSAERRAAMRPRTSHGRRATIVALTAHVLYEVGVDHNRFSANSLRAPRLRDDARSDSGQSGNSALRLKAPIVGFRKWNLNVPSMVVGEEIVDAPPQLFGAMWRGRSEPFEWSDAEKVAECIKNTHRAPVEVCSCGLYATHSQPIYTASVPLMRIFRSRGCHVVGAVLGSGDVLVHDDGWRAERARIIGFRDDVDLKYLPALHDIAAKFDVPILSADRLEALALSKGARLLKSEIPSPEL